MYNVIVSPEVNEDLEKFPDEILSEVFEYFEMYKTKPLKHSQKLYNKFGLNLEGYRKTYIANATYRIVIKVEKNVTKIVEVIAVGKREEKEVYKTAHERINSK